MRVINPVTSSQFNMTNSQLPLLLLVVLAVVLPQVLGDGYGGHGHGGGYGDMGDMVVISEILSCRYQYHLYRYWYFMSS